MLQNSFIFLDGVGPVLEKRIWSQDIFDWSSFLRSEKVKGISSKRKAFYDRQLRIAMRNLDNPPFFDFKGSEAWRLFGSFKQEVVYLDIEAIGFDVVLIGVSDGQSYVPLVKGHNLTKQSLLLALKDAKLVVTFNGLSFDVPFLRKFFGSLPDIQVFDLRFCLQRLGITGGLKEIEKRFSLPRNFECVNIMDLWESFKLGEKDALLTLIDYNRDDVMNLVPLADFVYKEMKKTFFSSEILSEKNY